MGDFSLKTPVLFLVFNRLVTTQKVFEQIRQAKPQKLFVASDGARSHLTEEKAKVKEIRDFILKNIDWECEVKTLFREENLGCGKAVATAIDWFFSEVEEGIILEDDCLPDSTFFFYCQELLEKYREEERIMVISGNNFQDGQKRGEASYYFSIYSHCWGWASWRRAWQKFDLQMPTFPAFKKSEKIKELFPTKAEQIYWLDLFQEQYDQKLPSVWDFAWTYACFANNALTCLPNVNLISNIGHGTMSTHTGNKNDALANLPLQKITLPLIHPLEIKRDFEADKYTNQKVFKAFLARVLFLKFLKKIGLFEPCKKLYFKIHNSF